MKTLAEARFNRPFTGQIELIEPNGAGAFVLPNAVGTYRLRLWHYLGAAHFAEASIGNGKMTITTTAAATVIDFSFPDSDMALASLGYGSMELISVTDNKMVVQPPVIYRAESAPYTTENGEKLAIFNEKIVATISSLSLQYIFGPTAIAINMLAPGSAGSGTYDGTTLTLNLPTGATGSNGVMSAAEVARGSLALNLARPDLLGRKAMCVDLVGGGFAHLDDVAGHSLASIENVAGVTLVATAGSFTAGRKGLLVPATANRLRTNHLASCLPTGALFEAQATNLIIQSQNFASGWTLVNTTLAAATAPDGSATASLLTDDATNGFHRTNRNTTGTTSGSTYCASFFVKAGSLSRVQLGRASGGSAIFNLVAGTVQSSTGATLVGAGIAAVGQGWFRIWIADNAALTAFNTLLNLCDASGNVSFAGTGTGQVLIWGAQLEENSVPSSYMPTTTAAVLRATDQLLLPVAGMDLMGTCLAAELVVPPLVPTNRFICQLRGNVSNRFLLQLNATNNLIASFVGNGTTVNLTLATGLAPQSLVRVAASADMGNGILRGKVSGVAAPAEGALAVAPVIAPDSLSVGSNNGTSNVLQGGVRSVVAVDRSWTASEIAGFTG